MTEKSSMSAAVREAVIRRPTGAAATARAASAFQGYDEASQLTPMPAPVGHEAMRTTLLLQQTMRTALKRRALDQETTMGELIRTAINLGLKDPVGLARASVTHRGAGGGVRTTLDLPRAMHRTLKRVVADEATSLQALVMAAIVQTYPDLR
ncbi:hypothetical protein Mkiyose1665_52780 [Mycobacterium kiyosense]|nr:hypothetical protein IWGMT90018_48060 [Mycobacterium kiyosense]GLB92060.1 hypothetical protein SRL2020130_48770 [Mycobacterium kiyosense]GLB99411.1 hypothetical protein SRL2020400_00030 [Mycobacterium kiyosense]GLC06330.1 hypothetical protein SRL2020411_09760 [Mycobacterium kiyosense]GLD02228.1 hypothetical protein Mkiyose1088_40940 [Mycobacterium kiyosense]